MASIMASSTLADAPRDWRISADSDEPELLSLDDASSTSRTTTWIRQTLVQKTKMHHSAPEHQQVSAIEFR